MARLARYRPSTMTVEALSRSEEHTSELQSLRHLVCRLLLEKKKKKKHAIQGADDLTDTSSNAITVIGDCSHRHTLRSCLWTARHPSILWTTPPAGRIHSYHL